MDLKKIRKTEDVKVSVVDVIAQVKKCTGNYAAQVYKRLLEEERVPKCEVRNIAHTAPGCTTARCSRQNRNEYNTGKMHETYSKHMFFFTTTGL